MLGAVSSRVRRVGLRVPHPSQLASARKNLAAALNLALDSHPSQRLYVVRKLVLERISAAAGPAQISSRIEADVLRLQSSAVPATRSDARNANAVFFEDPLAAYVALALHLGSGAAADAWFWPLAVPRYRPRMSRVEGLRAVLASVLESEPVVPAMAAFIAALCEHGCMMPLLAALRSEDMMQLEARCGLSVHVRMNAAETRSRPGSAAMAATRRLPYTRALRATLQAWTADAAFKPWVASMLLIAGAPQRSGDADLSLRAQQWLAQIEDSDGAASVLSAHTEISPPAARIRSAMPFPPAEPAAVGNAPTEIHVRIQRRPYAVPVVSSSKRAAALDLPPGAVRANEEFAISGNAGLLFLINVMVRLGLPQWLAENRSWAAWGLVPRLFEALKTHLQIGDDDLIAMALPQRDSEQVAPDSFALPAAWRVLCGDSPVERRTTTPAAAQLITALSGRLPLAGWRGGAAGVRAAAYGMRVAASVKPYAGSMEDSLVNAWRNAMRLWCRRYCGMGLLGIVRRTGYVAASATHVDVTFDLDAADIRLRRAGVDIDPGWVPWAGRVIRFHFGKGRQ